MKTGCRSARSKEGTPRPPGRAKDRPSMRVATSKVAKKVPGVGAKSQTKSQTGPLDVMAMVAIYCSAELSLSTSDMAEFITNKFKDVSSSRLAMRLHYVCKKNALFEEIEEYKGKKQRAWQLLKGKVITLKNSIDKYVDGHPDEAKNHGIEKTAAFLRSKNRQMQTELDRKRRQSKPASNVLPPTSVVKKRRGRSVTSEGRPPTPSSTPKSIHAASVQQKMTGRQGNVGTPAGAQKPRGRSVQRSPPPSTTARTNNSSSKTQKQREGSVRGSDTPTTRSQKAQKEVSSARGAAVPPSTARITRSGRLSNNRFRYTPPLARESPTPHVVVPHEDEGVADEVDEEMEDQGRAQSPDVDVPGEHAVPPVEEAVHDTSRDESHADDPLADFLPRLDVTAFAHSVRGLVEYSDSEEGTEVAAPPPPKQRRLYFGSNAKEQKEEESRAQSEEGDEEDLTDEEEEHIEAEEEHMDDEEEEEIDVEEEVEGVSEMVGDVLVYGSPDGEKYATVRSLGQGAFGQVHLVSDSEKREFALKITSAADVDLESAAGENAFYAKVLAAPKQCEFLAAKYPLFQTRLDDVVFRCERMDLYKRDLYDTLYKDRVTFTTCQILETLHQICSALDYLNKLGFIHSDVKPDNIMLASYDLEEDGDKVFIRKIDARLIDFNVIIEKENDAPFNFTGQTYPYMSPEMALEMACDARIDTWGLAVVALQMLAKAFFILNDDDVEVAKDDDEAKNAIILGEIERLFGPIPLAMKEQSRFPSFRDKPFFPSVIQPTARCEIRLVDVFTRHLDAEDPATLQLRETFGEMLSVDVEERPFPGDIHEHLDDILPYLKAL